MLRLVSLSDLVAYESQFTCGIEEEMNRMTKSKKENIKSDYQKELGIDASFLTRSFRERYKIGRA